MMNEYWLATGKPADTIEELERWCASLSAPEWEQVNGQMNDPAVVRQYLTTTSEASSRRATADERQEFMEWVRGQSRRAE